MGILSNIINFKENKEFGQMRKTVDLINKLEASMKALPDSEFPLLTQKFKDRIENGETLDNLLPEAFAACREAAFRTIGLRHFDVQLMGGMVLHNGDVAEMKTGEGKTLVATLAAYLNALTGKGVHVVTVNDYLAKRDSEWMGKVYEFMGMSVGCVVNELGRKARRSAYEADITYGTNNEFGFDYLRDNMALNEEELMQRELNFAIIDEADSILIDEARTPLIISGTTDNVSLHYHQANELVNTFTDDDFVIDEQKNTVALSDSGVVKAESFFKIDNLSDLENIEIHHRVNQAMKAHKLMRKDVKYIVKDGEVLLVDEFTGRLTPGRRFSDGLHQAIEAKEGLEIKKENQTLATVTLQNYFRMYKKLSGMTGTAKTEEAEFIEIYNMTVKEIPTNKPIHRVDKDDLVFMTKKEKINAVVQKIEHCYGIKRPVLVGTTSVEKSEQLSEILTKKGIPHNVLNAKQHEREAEIVANAGRLGAVTIATNMAGRGTDILLGGNHNHYVEKELGKIAELEITEGKDYTDAKERVKAEAKAAQNIEHKAVVSLGGLYIIGTDRHEARRIDNQLRGRAGRQGDPGTTEFYLSLEDDVLRAFGGDRIQLLCSKLGTKEGHAIKSGALSKTIEGAQKKLEAQNFEIRKYVLQYDNTNNSQRLVAYGERKKVLLGEDLRPTIRSMIENIVTGTIDSFTGESRFAEEWRLGEAFEALKNITPDFNAPELQHYETLSLTKEELIENTTNQFNSIYEKREDEIGQEAMRELERKVMLQVLDYKWMEHIDNMDQFKAGIGLRAIGNEDPAAVYAKEGFLMFQEMLQSMEEEVVSLILKKQGNGAQD